MGRTSRIACSKPTFATGRWKSATSRLRVVAIRITLERCPPELSADLVDRGIVMAGGGALLRGIDRLVAEETGLPVHIADDPLSAVAEGTGRVLQELQFLKRVTNSSGTRA